MKVEEAQVGVDEIQTEGDKLPLRVNDSGMGVDELRASRQSVWDLEVYLLLRSCRILAWQVTDVV